MNFRETDISNLQDSTTMSVNGIEKVKDIEGLDIAVTGVSLMESHDTLSDTSELVDGPSNKVSVESASIGSPELFEVAPLGPREDEASGGTFRVRRDCFDEMRVVQFSHKFESCPFFVIKLADI
jgi:hypothetical protein